MNDEEKRFARIQTDVQIWLGLFLGCIALGGAFLIAGAQLRFIYAPYSYLLYGAAVFFIAYGFIYKDKFVKRRKEMDES
ncbi:MAG: hypothetical protein ABSC20_06275 [Candidatus Bathyarchaeia archaeon]|jgi:flagellar motor component MotA